MARSVDPTAHGRILYAVLRESRKRDYLWPSPEAVLAEYQRLFHGSPASLQALQQRLYRLRTSHPGLSYTTPNGTTYFDVERTVTDPTTANLALCVLEEHRRLGGPVPLERALELAESLKIPAERAKLLLRTLMTDEVKYLSLMLHNRVAPTKRLLVESEYLRLLRSQALAPHPVEVVF